ncbi:MAG TPA: hypothetical protein VG406_28365 [Isosphaeraceae bacterium]|jgi:hypothetical protein|nr:hypothetical protein [Isosphaeraceae bacterium]
MRQGSTRTVARAAARVLGIGLLALPGPASARAGGEFVVPDSALGTRVAPVLLLSRPDVREDLGLSPEQAVEAARIIAELRARAAALADRQGPEIVAARRDIDAAGLRWLDAGLTTKQRGRIDQLDLQWEGPAVLVTRPAVADALKLTAEQRRRLAEAVVRRNRRREQGDDLKQAEGELARQALGILKADQKSRWNAMLGRHFAVRLASRDAARTKDRDTARAKAEARR